MQNKSERNEHLFSLPLCGSYCNKEHEPWLGAITFSCAVSGLTPSRFQCFIHGLGRSLVSALLTAVSQYAVFWLAKDALLPLDRCHIARLFVLFCFTLTAAGFHHAYQEASISVMF